MKNKIVFRVFTVVLVILILFVLSKVYHFVIMNHLFEAIVKFRSEENRAYLVDVRMSEDIVLQEETLLKQEIVKYVNKKDGRDLNYRWKNFDTNENYFININSKSVYANDEIIQSKNILPNLPNLIGYISEEDGVNLLKVFEICYIIPTKYENKNCYKIVTKNEVIVIDKKTYLPVYSALKILDYNEENNNQVEKTYEFKVGEVTDEDVMLPDLTNYTTVEQ